MLRKIKRSVKQMLRPLTQRWMTRARLVRALRELGVREGGVLLVHSSLTQIGYVPGGAKTVLRALVEVLGEKGTLVLPTHTWKWMNAGCRVFDVRTTPSCVGVLPEVFRQMPGVVRSLHPTHSVAALGPLAEFFIEGHEHATTPCGEGTPYAKLMEADGQILFLGAVIAANTCFHALEALHGFPKLLRDERDEFEIIAADGTKQNLIVPQHLEGIARRYAEMEEPLVAAGAAKRRSLGTCKLVLLSGRGLSEVVGRLLQDDPLCLMAPPAEAVSATGRGFGKHLLRGSGVNMLDLVIKTAAVFVTTPVMVRSLGQEGYGTWLLAMTVVAYFLLVDMGVAFSSTRFIAMALGSGNKERLGALMVATQRFFRLAGILVVAASALALPFASWLVPEGYVSCFRWVLGVCGCGVALRFFFRMPVILLRANVRYDLQAWASIGRSLMQAPAMYYVLVQGGGLFGAALVQGGGECIELTFLALLAQRFPRPVCAALTAEKDRGLRRELFSYSRTIVLGMVGESLRTEVNPFLITRLGGVERVPIYSIGLRLITMLLDVVNALFGGQLLAAFSQLHGADDGETLRRQFQRISQVTAAFSACAMGGAVWLAKPFLSRWVGAELAPAHEVMLLLSVPYCLHFMQYPAYNLLYTLGKTNWVVTMSFIGGAISALVSALLGWWLSPEHVVRGVVLGTAALKLLERGVVMPILVSRCLPVTAWNYLFINSLWPAAKALVLPALYAWLVHSWLTPDYSRILLLTAGYVTVCVVSAPFTALDADMRGSVFRTLRRR